MTAPQTPRVDEYGVVDPLRLQPAGRMGERLRERLGPMSPVFWAFVALALVEMVLETRRLAPLAADVLLVVAWRSAEVLGPTALVLLPTAVLFAAPRAGLRDRLLIGSALVAAVGPVSLVIDTLWRDTAPATPGIDPLTAAYGVATLVVPAVGWLLVASAVRPSGLVLGRLRPVALVVAVVGIFGAVLAFALDVVVARNISGSDVPEATFDASSFLAFSAVASVAALGVVIFATVAVGRAGSDTGRPARRAALGASLLVVRLIPGPAVALVLLALRASEGYDATWTYSLASVLALAGYVLLLLAFGSGYGRTEEPGSSVAPA